MGHSTSKYRRRHNHQQNPSLPLPDNYASSSSPTGAPTISTTISDNNRDGVYATNSNANTDPCPPQDNPFLYSSSSSSYSRSSLPSNPPPTVALAPPPPALAPAAAAAPPPPPPLPPLPQPPQSAYAFAANAPYPLASPSIPQLLPIPSSTYNPIISNSFNYPPPIAGCLTYHSYYASHPNGWAPFRLPMLAPPRPLLPAVPPPPYVDNRNAKKIKNDVNVHKETIKVVLDKNNLDSYLVSFTFDALVDGSITVYYFAKEGANCTFTPQYPEIYMPRRIPFHEGLGQKFFQPSGSGIDLGFFALEDLSKPSLKEDIFPLVISAETCIPSFSMGQGADVPPSTSPHAQITQAVLVKSSEGHFQVKVVKQILWVDDVRYELREIYGIRNSDEAGFDDSESGEECVICMTEPKDTAALPCRHMCMCSECAKELKLQSNKCPICRQPIQEFIEIKVKGESS